LSLSLCSTEKRLVAEEAESRIVTGWARKGLEQLSAKTRRFGGLLSCSILFDVSAQAKDLEV
jgi:hypothetical protein